MRRIILQSTNLCQPDRHDSTDPESRADVGRGGVAIDILDDMRLLFDGIPIREISTSLVTCLPISRN